jgi:hypothetical protein
MSKKRSSSARPLRDPGYKGKWMPSFARQLDTVNKKILIWKPGAQSTKQCKRNLRTKVKHIIDSTDPVVISIGDRVIRSVCHEPDPEFTALHLFAAGLDMAVETSQPWVVCMNYLMDKFDGKIQTSELEVTVIDEEESDADTITTAAERPSRISGLLRTLVARCTGARTEKRAGKSVDQSAGTGDGQHRDSVGSHPA